MSSVVNFVRKLQDPELVVKFQNYCGIHIVNEDENSENVNIHQVKSQDIGNELDELGDKPEKLLEDKFENEEKNKKDENVGGSEGLIQNDNSIEVKQNPKKINYIITNKFLYYLFLIATKTGDEIFYITFFPFWNWNVDGAVMREVIYIWTFTMYIGQALKDILRVPRPSSPPVVRLDSKWGLEYGLPSTHAMVAFSIPFSILILSLDRYQLNFGLCFCDRPYMVYPCVCFKNLFRNAFCFVGGLVLIAGLLSVLLPVIVALDRFMLTHPFSPLLSITLTIAMVVCYPTSDRWTSARGDTTVMVGVGCGCLVGYWMNYQIGMIYEPEVQPPFSIIWPTTKMVGLKPIFKPLSINTICVLLQVDPKTYQTCPSKIPEKQRVIIELFYKFVTYMTIGFAIVCTCPILFKLLSIERLTFYTEM
ncbi:Sphingosine-1-phosphate phosphatase 2, partial [Armadillidium nasatum]